MFLYCDPWRFSISISEKNKKTFFSFQVNFLQPCRRLEAWLAWVSVCLSFCFSPMCGDCSNSANPEQTVTNLIGKVSTISSLTFQSELLTKCVGLTKKEKLFYCLKIFLSLFELLTLCQKAITLKTFVGWRFNIVKKKKKLVSFKRTISWLHRSLTEKCFKVKQTVFLCEKMRSKWKPINFKTLDHFHLQKPNSNFLFVSKFSLKNYLIGVVIFYVKKVLMVTKKWNEKYIPNI